MSLVQKISTHYKSVKVRSVPNTQTVSHFPIPSFFRSKPDSMGEVILAFPFECSYGYTKLFIETSDEAFCVWLGGVKVATRSYLLSTNLQGTKHNVHLQLVESISNLQDEDMRESMDCDHHDSLNRSPGSAFRVLILKSFQSVGYWVVFLWLTFSFTRGKPSVPGRGRKVALCQSRAEPVREQVKAEKGNESRIFATHMNK